MSDKNWDNETNILYLTNLLRKGRGFLQLDHNGAGRKVLRSESLARR